VEALRFFNLNDAVSNLQRMILFCSGNELLDWATSTPRAYDCKSGAYGAFHREKDFEPRKAARHIAAAFCSAASDDKPDDGGVWVTALANSSHRRSN
jgi:hypothetical protein